jgi:excisionase family DNA binding protein
MTVFTHQEAAAFLKVNEATLRKLRRRGDIHGTRVGAQYRYLREHLEGYLRGSVQAPIEPISESPPLMPMPAQSAPVDPPNRAVHHRGFYALNGGSRH